MDDKDRYAERGVSSTKEGVHAAVAALDKGLYPGAFCQIMPLDDQCHAIMHADGAGTKADLAYLAHKHGHPIKAWRGITQDSIVMNIDDVACVGALLEKTYINQAINRDTFVIPDEIIAELVAGGADFCKKMQALGFPLVLSGGETADVPDLVRTITVDNSLFTTIKDRHVVDASRIRAGDAIVGFSSTGQAAWEDEPNSGIGSHGLTNARHDCLHPDYRADTETYSPELPPEKVYCGKYHLDDPLPGDSRFSIASALLSPTRTYAPLIKKILRTCPYIEPEQIHAFIHCSGGGQTKIGKFGPPDVMYIKDKLFPTPPLFKVLQESSQLPWKQMYKSYNMGHRLEAVVAPEAAQACIDAAEACNIKARKVGMVLERPHTSPRVRIVRANEIFAY